MRHRSAIAAVIGALVFAGCNVDIQNLGGSLPAPACDAEIGEECSCQDGDQQPCYGGPSGTMNVGLCVAGTQTCESGAWTACTGGVFPAVEVCDSLDNDCNGSTDDGAAGAGDQCVTPIFGECAKGVTVCEGGVLTCMQMVFPSLESCDGADNDCDGVVDNDSLCCSDSLKNGSETDVDCGGDCLQKCQAGQACKAPSDCTTNICMSGVCAP